MAQPLDEEERAEMLGLACSRQSLLPKAFLDRLGELQRRHVDAQDDRVAESIEFPPDEGS